MKCPECDGYGYEGYSIQECVLCHGKRYVSPMTNEEWLRQCSTEELSEFLLDVWYGIDDVINIMEREDVGKKEAMLIWLKEKHTE